MSTVLYHSMDYRKYYLVMKETIPISYPNPGMVLWGYCHSYCRYIPRSSYSIFWYLHDFPQCLHWFCLLVHIRFHTLLFLLLQLMVSSNAQIIIHKLVPLQDQNIPFSDTSMIFLNVCTDSTRSSTLGFTHSCGCFYDLWYPLMYKLLSINCTTRP